MPKYPKTPKGWYSADIDWNIPGRKRPIAYSTVATSLSIVEMAKDGGTVKELRDKMIYDREAQMVLDEYIKRGFGDMMAQEFFSRRYKRDGKGNHG